MAKENRVHCQVHHSGMKYKHTMCSVSMIGNRTTATGNYQRRGVLAVPGAALVQRLAAHGMGNITQMNETECTISMKITLLR